jgi:hypothetical protein
VLIDESNRGVIVDLTDVRPAKSIEDPGELDEAWTWATDHVGDETGEQIYVGAFDDAFSPHRRNFDAYKSEFNLSRIAQTGYAAASHFRHVRGAIESLRSPDAHPDADEVLRGHFVELRKVWSWLHPMPGRPDDSASLPVAPEPAETPSEIAEIKPLYENVDGRARARYL